MLEKIICYCTKCDNEINLSMDKCPKCNWGLGGVNAQSNKFMQKLLKEQSEPRVSRSGFFY